MSFLFSLPRRTAPLPNEISVKLPGGAVALKLRRSPRAKRLLLRLDPRDGRVELVLPPKARIEDGLAFAHLQSAWIESRLSARPAAIPFVDGAEVPVLGIAHRIIHERARRGPPVQAVDGCLYVGGDPGFLARRVSDHLKARARRELLLRVQNFAAQLGRKPGRIALRDTVTRWGSCSAKGDMTFSWRLVLSPEPVLTYVAAHECAHLVELNHSRRFWDLVARLVPDGDDAKGWLKQHGVQLLRYGG